MVDKKILDTLIGVFVGGILAAVLIPIALQQLAAAVFINFSGDGTNVPAEQIVLFGVIAIAVIVVVVLIFFKMI